jgi:hypothetical protein
MVKWAKRVAQAYNRIGDARDLLEQAQSAKDIASGCGDLGDAITVAGGLASRRGRGGDSSRGINNSNQGINLDETGSYTNTHASGKTYSGKGSRRRSQTSGRRKARTYNDEHVATDWTPAPNYREAYKAESRRIDANGGKSSTSNYNIKESPGRKYRQEDGDL